MKHPKFTRSFEVVAELPEALQPLRDLAQNFLWTWRHETRQLFKAIDRDSWECCGHNPQQLVATITPEKAKRLCEDDIFMAKLQLCHKEMLEYMSGTTWFDAQYPDYKDKIKIAYFCAEFGISESLPIYSGGLGILAGDHLKAASDLGIPLVGVGLLYSRGYFRQHLTFDGWQQEYYPQYDFGQMSLQLLRGPDEQPLRVEVELPDRLITCQIWRAQVGRIPLYLLDSNVMENAPSDQSVTDTLYGGDEEMRIRQEMILGIGGMRALRAVGINPTVCHMNEGHAAFLSVERIRQFIAENKTEFRTARQVVVGGNVFTTHTPVPAGFDRFTPDLLKRYMGTSVQSVGVPFDEFVKLGRVEKENRGEAFNMAVLAMENSDHVNGVSKLHAAVTRSMFQARWPGYPEEEVPVDAITNGIHTLTWVSRRMAALFDEYLGPEWRDAAVDPEIWQGVEDIPDAELWAVRENQRGDFIRFVRRRLQRDLERRNMSKPDFNLIGTILDPRVLTIGFARRFATYKRATLMLSDRDRLLRLLNHGERPVQFVIAGKSHPADEAGKKLIQEIVKFIVENARSRMVFLEDYDMAVARAMVQGVDVWLNNPRRPNEASGTSGMKVVPNGGLNCSVLDGWWDEGYDGRTGFAIGDRLSSPDEGYQDWVDAHSLYARIENEVAPKFYHRVEGGVPSGWVRMMKDSIKDLAPQFSTRRMVAEYTNKFYIPAADSFMNLQQDKLALAKDALAWRDRVRAAWPNLQIVSVSDDAHASNKEGSKCCVTAMVDLPNLAPNDVSVEIVFGKVGSNRDLLDTQHVQMQLDGSNGSTHTFKGAVSLESAGYQGYTVRILPFHDHVNVASQLHLVQWYPGK